MGAKIGANPGSQKFGQEESIIGASGVGPRARAAKYCGICLNLSIVDGYEALGATGLFLPLRESMLILGTLPPDAFRGDDTKGVWIRTELNKINLT